MRIILIHKSVITKNLIIGIRGFMINSNEINYAKCCFAPYILSVRQGKIENEYKIRSFLEHSGANLSSFKIVLHRQMD